MAFDPVFSTLPDTIFDVMSGLARAHGAINLGQGFPDGQGPEALRRAAGRALMEGSNQYPPMRGLPVLRAAVADHYGRHQGLNLAPDDVLVTSGATEALAAAFLGLLAPGDEVIVLDPAYDAYRPLIARAGGVARSVVLRPPHWRLDVAAIAAAITPRTKAIVFNDPLNPLGRAFDAGEVAALAALCRDHQLIAICDEVWEHIVFDGRTHHPLMAEPGMAQRCVKIGSAGKIFSMTGWKVGFVMAGPELMGPIVRAHQFLTFTTPPHLQEAVAEGLAWGPDWFDAMRAGFAASRDRMTAGLTAAGFSVQPSEGTYFVCVDLAASGVARDPMDFCRRAVTDFGVAAIPLAPFYADPADAPPVIRLCFAKQDATIDAGLACLARAREAMAG
jgi:N-succinyldiaminopimelate aminotransferase